MTDVSQRILVVDDLPDWRATLRGLLEDAGYDVDACMPISLRNCACVPFSGL